MRQFIIGLSAEIIGSKNPGNVGIKGRIINETKNTISIKTQDKTKMVFKKNITLSIDGNRVDGCTILGRLQDRLTR